VAAKGPHGEGKSGAGGEKLDKNRKKEVKHRQEYGFDVRAGTLGSRIFFSSFFPLPLFLASSLY